MGMSTGGMGHSAANAAGEDALQLWETDNRSGFLVTVDDTPGKLAYVLNTMSKYNIDLTQIQSKPPKVMSGERTMNFHIDFHGSVNDANIKACSDELRQNVINITELGTDTVPWFPTKITDFDFIGKRVLAEGDGIQAADHPGFRDEEYRRRRKEITDLAFSYRVHEPIPRLVYNENEKATWKLCYETLRELYKTNACKEFNWTINEFEKEVGFRSTEIPQLNDISQYLQSQTGWRLKPVGGLLTQREFLNGLAFKIFHSTQYIRHHSAPLYTPEPDIVHELMGHAPMFAHQEFSDFS